jgi:hypothetical protein
VRTATTIETITMGNSSEESTEEIGTLPGIVCDQYGNKLNKVAIPVALLPLHGRQ